ncbi:metalloprotease PmbA [Wenzhouxiangella sp. XN24]|uniref:metalloprotease PmbA n=1 Tax=Wenzhouxiangella sp. XN24 TaxID=2713569 RepID=UPI0013EC6D34|nr:metalloprotease PmbA [Wenzhouxiangella sp. XN24]NGX15903.1 metalloprotease PmbA [Wenzhouxiangella sp. XN24]
MSSADLSDLGAARQRLEALAADALARASTSGADATEVGASLGTGLSVTVRKGEVETLEHQRDRGFSVTVYFGRRKGSASTSDLSAAALAETVDKACTIARYTAEDPCAGLADATMMAREILDLDLDHPWDLDPDHAVVLARDCEAAGLDSDERISNTEGGSLSSHRSLRVYANSHGFSGGYASTSHSLSCSLIAGRGDEMQRDYWYTVARRAEDLESPAAVGRRAAERALRRVGARRIGTRSVPVIFVAELARGFLGHLVAAIRGAAQYRKASFLLDAAGTQVLPEWFDIDERPHVPRALGSAPFDAEGVATRDRALVAGGILQGYVLSSYSARRLGLQTTGNAGGIHNLLVRPGDAGLEGLMRRMGRGLVVTELMGHGVNAVTGDYSRGASGFWVEGGEIVHPVQEVTIAGNLKTLFADIQAVGSDVDRRGVIQTGSLLIGRMTVAGD